MPTVRPGEGEDTAPPRGGEEPGPVFFFFFKDVLIYWRERE